MTERKKRTNNDLQNITQKNKDRATRSPPETEVKLRCSGRIGSSYSSRRVNHVTSDELEKDRIVIKTNRTYYPNCK
jgi:hypothetical protein